MGVMSLTCTALCLAAGCASDPSMRFSVYVEVTPEIDHVTADAHELPIHVAGAVRSITYETTFPGYAAAMTAPPVAFEFSSAGQTEYVGHSKPGLCHASCTDPSCPTDSELVSELVQVAVGNFTTSDFQCITCSNGQQMIDVCPEATAR